MAGLTRAALRLLEWPYTAAVRWRNHRYDRGRAEIVRVEVPVVSVGNLTLGGTGKTPAVEWLANWLAQRQVRVGLVSRGYGARAGEVNDEALELAQKLAGVPHVQNPDRVAGAREAIERFGCQAIVLDDGFQHRRIAREFDLVLVDALEPLGFGHVFPRGTLREPLSGWSRANAILLTRADMIDADQRDAIRKTVRTYAPRAIWAESRYYPRCLTACDRSEQPLEMLRGHRVAMVCGIGNPTGFRRALEGLNYLVVATREFDDHHPYSAQEVADLAEWCHTLDISGVLCTYKDLVKLSTHWPQGRPLYALTSRLEITRGLAELESALAPLAARAAGQA